MKSGDATGDDAARLAAWVRERAALGELSTETRAWLATSPGAMERPPASVLHDLLLTLALPEATRVLDRGELAHEVSDAARARLEVLGRLARWSDDGVSRN